ncbi:NHLP bacteriocin export ABC transporter permease/ATPase subunit [Streptomyces sp. TRM64462]|uniref:NHLP bacteriocin export ABC transporter permease/ATPase subunit n=1 Tax=Streptomyces sp. TRM64462 TaxID=2741726 RepID=UPI001585E5EB|nr:NHLP bacteriocin export ABC transporter permease/ATPase subunit [Streptomyces sp. TRM64462]
MTSETPAVLDPVVHALGGLGTHVDGSGERTVHLEGPQVLWLVVAGGLDLFAVDVAREGPWHFLGRLEAGSLLLGPVAGPQHTLLARPSQDCALRRIGLRELWNDQTYGHGHGHGYEQGYEQGYGPGHGYGEPQRQPSPLEHAFALGTARSLGVLFEAPLGDRDAAEASVEHAPAGDEDMLWMPVPPGSVRYGAEFAADAAAELMVDGGLWQRMVNQQHRLLSAVDRWIERLERAHEDRTAAGIRAGEAVRARADQALLASIGGPRRAGGGSRTDAASDDLAFAVCRRVARAAGVTLTEPSARAGSTADGGDRLDVVERIAVASRVRTRAVRLDGPWWRRDAGPLVGRWASSGAPVALLWRRGRYEAVNPASGLRRRVDARTAAELEPRAVMFYRPLPDRPMAAWRLARFTLRGSGRDLRNLVLAGLVSVALGALVPVATGKVLGEYVAAAERSLIVQTALAVVVAGVVSAAFALLQNLTVLRIEGRIESVLQPAVWDRLLRLPARFFAGRSTGELASAAMGISAVRRVLSGTGPVVVQSCTVGFVNLALLLWFSVPLALVALAMLLVAGVLFLGLGLWQVRWQRRLVKLTHRLNNQAYQTLRGLPKLRVAAAESFAYAAWAGEFARSRELHRRAGRIKNLTTVVDAVHLPLCMLALFMLLAGPARGTLSAAGFLTFSTSVTMLLTSVTMLTGALVSAAAALPLYEQVKPVLEEAPEVRGGSARPGVLSGAIEVRDVSFRYGDDAPLTLDGVSFRIEPGEFVAVVGPSGCGKSTLLRLLIGFEQPSSGSVLYDGQDLAALDRAAVRRQCGVVLQHAQPLTGSIMDCICGAESFSPDEVWAAAEMAGLAEDIRRMPMGLHTMIASGGAVSGGQRQRLMIAQALIRRPRILFFDEATSALDNATQRTVMESTHRLDATRLVIAHRLSTVLDADRVIVLSAGRIVEEGAPATLLADTGGHLYELVVRQMI